MSELHFPWLEASVLIGLVGAIWVGRLRDQFVACRHSLYLNSLTLLMTVGAWIDYEFLNPAGAAPSEAQSPDEVPGKPVTSSMLRKLATLKPVTITPESSASQPWQSPCAATGC